MFHDQADTFAKSIDRTMTPTRAECIARVQAARSRLHNAARRPAAKPVVRIDPIPAPRIPIRDIAAPREAAILTLRETTFLSVSQIIEIVARAHQMSTQRLMAHCRERGVTRARKHLVHILYREKPNLSSVEIGRRIGGFDHSSILHARDTFDKDAPLIAEQIKAVDEALARRHNG